MTNHRSAHTYSSARARGLKRATIGAAAVAACFASAASVPTLAGAAVPSAASSALSRADGSSSSLSLASPYGQEHRFGGFGTTPGKFVTPVGFAVDPKDSSTSDRNAVYVLDQTVQNSETGELDYRLQKLSSSGTVLGSVALPLQTYTETETAEGAHPLISLTVDSSKHRVYALVQTIVNSGRRDQVPVASELVAWSTVPNASKQLVAAPGYPEDPITHGALVAGSSVLAPGEPASDLYAPAGITVNPSNHDVVIEAQQGVKNGTEGGPTILQAVATEGSKSGQLDGSWVANATIAPGGEAPDGLFTTSEGSFGVKLFQARGAISRLAEVGPDFKSPEASLLAADTSGGLNLDEAPSIDNEQTVNARFDSRHGTIELGALSPYSAGSPVTQLSNGLYAARFGQELPGSDPQSEIAPWNTVPYFWLQQSEQLTRTANMGVRLFTASGAVVTTIGGQPEGQACNINFAPLAIAAGAKESVFVLTQPDEHDGDSNDEVIEFKPGGKGACPQPSGTITVNGKSGSSVTVATGAPVTLADTVERKGEAPYRFDWALLNASTLEVEDLTNQIEGPAYTWPAPSTSHTFSKEGTYYLASTLYGDYGIVQVGEVVEIKVN